jgi:TolA-binding protein
VRRPNIFGETPLNAYYSCVIISFILLSFSGCGLAERRNQNSDQAEGDQVQEPVSSEQHELLKQKYDELAKRYSLLQQELESTEGASPSILQDLNNNTQDQNKIKGDDLAETVDVFASQQRKREDKKSLNSSTPRISSENIDPDLIEEQIHILRKIEGLVNQNKFNNALNEIKKIEDSAIRQISVRAKFFLGEVLFAQEQYDLAMQVYEEIIKEDAFSGVVIKSLGRLIVCSESLKLDKKRDAYYSILHDFFERG